MDHQQRVLQLFEQSLELPADERSGFLKSATQGSDRLREDVLELLASHEDAQNFLVTEPASSSSTGCERAPGTIVDQYVLTEILGRGGMGIVYKARDTVVQRDVAIKFLPRTISTDDTNSTRFLTEARAAGQLNHPNVVSLFGVGHHEGDMFLIMELARGSVSELLEKAGHLDWSEATHIILQACRGLHAAHQAGFVHRDIKPQNLLITAHDVIKIADFGVARFVDASSMCISPVAGTPYYMSPEQCRGETSDARSDVYALGATYYTLLTGRKPYADSTTPLQVMSAHCHGEIPDPSKINREIPAACAEIVTRAMSKDPLARYETCGDMESALAAAISGTSASTADSSPLPGRRESPTTNPKLRTTAADGTIDATEVHESPALRRSTLHSRRPALIGLLFVAVGVAVGSIYYFVAHSVPNRALEKPPVVESVFSVDLDRQVATLIVGIGGQVDVRQGREDRVVDDVSDLPDGPFSVVWIALEHNRDVTDELMKELVPLQQLAGVSLRNTPISDVGMRRLSQLGELSAVFLSNTSVTDEGVLALARLPKLSRLHLDRTGITDRALQGLQDAPLTELHLDGTDVTDKGMDYVREMRSLKNLTLRQTRVSDKGLRRLRTLAKLQDLCIRSTRVTDEGLKSLRGMSSLKQIWLSDPKAPDSLISEEAVIDLRNARPGCVILFK